MKAWDMPTVAFLFAMSAGFYLFTRLVSPRIPHEGEVDLQAFHREEGRKYLAWFALLAAATVWANLLFGQAHGVGDYIAQNITVVPRAIAAGVSAVFIRRRFVQAVCLAVELAMWVIYIGFQQRPLAG